MDRDAMGSALEVWLAGGALPGVEFARGDAVVLLEGDQVGAAGRIAGLQSLAPEPLYTIALESGDDVGALQSSLRLAT
jgi:hypothetical protein